MHKFQLHCTANAQNIADFIMYNQWKYNELKLHNLKYTHTIYEHLQFYGVMYDNTYQTRIIFKICITLVKNCD